MPIILATQEADQEDRSLKPALASNPISKKKKKNHHKKGLVELRKV
jgi:hypothetical protein